eukprot:11926188-Alexandrium_andersonii.AAC.1
MLRKHACRKVKLEGGEAATVLPSWEWLQLGNWPANMMTRMAERSWLNDQMGRCTRVPCTRG